jgi:hypothetical protein
MLGGNWFQSASSLEEKALGMGRKGKEERNCFSTLPSQLHLVGPSRNVSMWKKENLIQLSHLIDR